jgi:hypothetical protein
MEKKNCWEMKNCGRQQGGNKVSEMGVCPASTDTASHGINHGKNAGRVCWCVAGTFCGGKKQGSYADKRLSCMTCEVFKAVMAEEGMGHFVMKCGEKSVSK